MEQAANAWAAKKIDLAVQAATKSHELAGDLIEALAEISQK